MINWWGRKKKKAQRRVVLVKQNEVPKAENNLGCHAPCCVGTSSVGEKLGCREPWSCSCLDAMRNMHYRFSQWGSGVLDHCVPFSSWETEVLPQAVQCSVRFVFLYIFCWNLNKTIGLDMNLVCFVQLANIILSWQLQLYLSWKSLLYSVAYQDIKKSNCSQ